MRPRDSVLLNIVVTIQHSGSKHRAVDIVLQNWPHTIFIKQQNQFQATNLIRDHPSLNTTFSVPHYALHCVNNTQKSVSDKVI